MEVLTSYRKNRSTLRTETLFLLGDPNAERYSAIRVNEKLNDACLDYCLRTQLIKEEINIQLLRNQHEYDIKARVEQDGTLRYFGFPIRIGYDGDDEPAVMPGSLLAIDLKGYRRDLSGIPYLWYLCAVSPGKIQIIGPPQEDGDAAPSENKNLQVSYIAMPTYMDADVGYPDTIPSYFHRYIPYGAATMILEEGDKNDLLKAMEYESIFYKGITEQVTEEYKSRTVYDDVRPL